MEGGGDVWKYHVNTRESVPEFGSFFFRSGGDSLTLRE